MRSSVSLDHLLAETRWARRLAASLVRGDDVDDVVSETFAVAVRHPPDPARPARPWLRAVLSNLVRNRARGEGRRRKYEAAAGTPEATGAPDELLARFEAHKRLAVAVAALPESHRSVVLLRYYEGRTSGEIAGVLSQPAGTVRRRLSEALAMLRARLDEGEGGWRRVVAPLVLAPVGISGRMVAGLVIGGLLIGGMVVGRRSGEPRVERAGVEVSRSASSTEPRAPLAGAPALMRSPALARGLLGGGGGGGEAVAGLSPEVVACRTRAEALRAEVAASDVELWRHAGAEYLAGVGAPNPAAEAELREVLPALLRGGRDETPPFSLECRTWACRLLVLERSEDSGRRAWAKGFRAVEPLQKRTRKIGFRGGPVPVEDPVSGASMWQIEGHFSLADPSGRPVERVVPPVVEVDRSPLPVSLVGCQAVVTGLEQRLEGQRAVVEKNMQPRGRFERASPDRRREPEMVRHLARALGDTTGIEVTCRENVCRLRGARLFAAKRTVSPALDLEEIERRRENVYEEETLYVELR